ncbi:pyruvate synthase [candidate division WOR-3 bacterium]|uniref:Pyruvate synthase n=1 Tax=candidate division WOR-3 bacterium TaxID=2052148 RepID=A0A9D5QDM6_UNCW3|nr:pyruvate synthase [candidate division WOR-3 bacterium]MBD3365247.1 pyruvate synthase [candidate division WOR-3 bacterium]
MQQYFEVRWHGRGGQGAKTAALLFGEAAMETGKYIQAFPEYGPERTGAPVKSFNRLADDPIRIHTQVINPNVVVVLDSSLLECLDVTEGIQEGGTLLINSQESADELKKKLAKTEGYKLAVVDASKIAMELLKRDVPNTVMLGAMVKVTGALEWDSALASIEKKLNVKFRGRKEIIEGNIKAIKRAYDEVKVA